MAYYYYWVLAGLLGPLFTIVLVEEAVELLDYYCRADEVPYDACYT